MKIYTTSLLGVNIALNNFNNRWIYDKPALIQQANKWSSDIPWIKPYYAVKSNPLPYILEDLVNYRSDKSFKIGLDVASLKETDLALKYTQLDNTIYTNPHTMPCEINKKCNIKVVDSVGEIELLKQYNINCPLLIRMNSCVNKAKINFNSKFGATIEEAHDIIKVAQHYNYLIKGVSFHIGSGGEFSRKDAFQTTFFTPFYISNADFKLYKNNLNIYYIYIYIIINGRRNIRSIQF